MTDGKLMFIDIEPTSSCCAHINSRPNNPVWSKSDNSFRFDFVPDDCPVPPSQTSADGAEPAREQMETTETQDTCSQDKQEGVREATSQDVSCHAEPVLQSKSKRNKKKKKSGKKQTSEAQQEKGPAKVNKAGKNTELSAEEQLNRQLDWCIEQLEMSFKSMKSTPKQKEEAYQALKTLRSSKAPLVKKRQVMRAMTGDYRQKMEEETKKQYKLIQTELASARVKVVSDSPKKCVFSRRGGAKSQKTTTAEEVLQQPEAQTSQTQEGTPAFVFVPTKEDFRFNFL
uniref:Zgc:112185 n=1 Tax=Takifugu rubripes TaxID=31033 RepID=A0A674N6R3_TAKRU